MIIFFKRYKYLLLSICFVLSILPFFWKLNNQSQYISVSQELYNPALNRLNSIEKLLLYNDSVYKTITNSQVFDTAIYVQTLSNTLKERFHFGLSHYTIADNWIAVVSSKLFWSHFSAIVNPDDILKENEGLCSQQTIVFMEALRRKGINVRTVGLGKIEGPGHFLCEVHYNNSWRLHDVTKEPEWGKIARHHESMDYYLLNKDSLFTVYAYKMSKKDFDEITENVKYGEMNKFPAKNMLVFHKITEFITYLLPLIIAFIYFRIIYRSK